MQFIPRLAAASLVVVLALIGLAGPASAHTGFESSDPADGASIDSPVEVVTVTFSGAAEPTGSGFQLLDTDGKVRTPTAATTEDGSTWNLRFDPPVEGGKVGVRWSVQAPDAHPISGAFSFTVTAPATPAGDAPGAQTSDEGTPAAVPDATAVPGDAANPDKTMDSFLDKGSRGTASADRLGTFGRMITLLGTLLGVGALVFAATVLRGTRQDVRHVLHWVRRAGLLVILGTFVELIAQMAVTGGGWSGIWSLSALTSVLGSSFGVATGLRLFGGAALLFGARLDTAPAADLPDRIVAMQSRIPVSIGAHHDAASVVDESRGSMSQESVPHGEDQAWRPTIESGMAFLGAIALLGAYLFDGHTVTKGPRLVTAMVDVVHVGGAAVWAGGVAMLAAILWRRHRQGRPPRVLHLALRFSVVATIAIVAVGVAGALLAIIILDAPSELWATNWGRLLIAKCVFVVVAVAAGAYNHRVLIPQMSTDPASPPLSTRFRSVVTGEAAALGIVLVFTALLMGAAS